jgi:hypothetical protein
MNKHNFPPSLSRMPGKSDAELEEERTLRQLCNAVSDLHPQPEAPYPEEAALDIYSTFLTARAAPHQKRKDGLASPSSVAKQLKQRDRIGDAREATNVSRQECIRGSKKRC